MFPMIPPQVNGATWVLSTGGPHEEIRLFPMIPPQVNGATAGRAVSTTGDLAMFPMIPPQVNGATLA